MAQGGPAGTEAFRRDASLWLHTGTRPELRGAWGRRWQVTEGSGAGTTAALASAPTTGRNKATAPKLGRLPPRQRIQGVTSSCRLRRASPVTPVRGEQQLIGAALGSRLPGPRAGAVLGQKLLCQAPQLVTVPLQRYGTKGGEELPTLPTVPQLHPAEWHATLRPKGMAGPPKPEAQTLRRRVQTHREHL